MLFHGPGYTLSGLAFKYAATKDEAVRRHADDVIRCMTNCIHISGTPGYCAGDTSQSTGYKGGKERESDARQNLPAGSGGEYSDKRYISSPSHHNHDHYIAD